MSGSFEDWLNGQLAELEALGRLRVPDDGQSRALAGAEARRLGVEMVDASSNDYLGLAPGGVSRETSVQHSDTASGSGASRLINGTHPAHVELERALADWVGLPEALLFTSGYAANVGLVSALAQPGSLVVSDQLNHASLIDGCRLSKARVEVVPHLSLGGVRRALESGGAAVQKLVVTESYFSMDGDAPDLPALRVLCDEHGARLIVDEAHALGVFGEDGSGRCQAAGVVPDTLIGTLGKSVGVQGAFVAGSEALRTLLWNRARSFVFSTGSSPLLAHVALFHVERARTAAESRARLHELAHQFRTNLRSRGIEIVHGSLGPIVPVMVGDNRRAVLAARYLQTQGILVQAIRPPTVPEGTARLRVTVSAAWPTEAPERVARVIDDALRA